METSKKITLGAIVGVFAVASMFMVAEGVKGKMAREAELQANPKVVASVAAYKKVQVNKLGEYAWADKKKGIVRVPIAAAKAMVLSKGLEIATIGGSALDPKLAAGMKVFNTLGCPACHSTDGRRIIGPTFKDSWGTERKLVGGATVIMNEAYFKRSLMEPAADVVEGYPPAMTPFKGRINDKEIKLLIGLIKSFSAGQ